VKKVSENKKTAENTEKTVKKSGESKLSKILSWFKNLPKRIAKPFKNMYYELKKVTWPSKHKLITYSVIVLLFMLFMGIVIGLLDMGASALINLLM
jgi:preprotein translocase subunit SecE